MVIHPRYRRFNRSASWLHCPPTSEDIGGTVQLLRQEEIHKSPVLWNSRLISEWARCTARLQGLDLNQRPLGYEPSELPTALPCDSVLMRPFSFLRAGRRVGADIMSGQAHSASPSIHRPGTTAKSILPARIGIYISSSSRSLVARFSQGAAPSASWLWLFALPGDLRLERVVGTWEERIIPKYYFCQLVFKYLGIRFFQAIGIK